MGLKCPRKPRSPLPRKGEDSGHPGSPHVLKVPPEEEEREHYSLFSLFYLSLETPWAANPLITTFGHTKVWKSSFPQEF